MPDNKPDQSQKTEQASKYKLKKSREAGQVAKSQDLSATASFVGAIIAIAMFLPHMGRELWKLFITLTQDFDASAITLDTLNSTFTYVFTSFAITIIPVMAIVWLITFVTATAQVGLHFSVKPLELNLEKINPISGMQRLVSLRSIVHTSLAVAKILLIVFVSGSVLWGNRNVFMRMNFQDIQAIVLTTGALIWEIAIKAAITLFIIALIDYAYQKWQFLEDQKMTKQEVKEEYKQQEGNPFIKGQVKQRQKSMAQKRGLQESVKMADVVVTNPFHIAVAIQYDRSQETAAPKVVAKGARLLAERIKKFAAEFDVDVIENIPVARALYKECNVDMEIPPDLYIAVAEILAVVYAKDKKAGKKN